jgi:hypothetical protein
MHSLEVQLERIRDEITLRSVLLRRRAEILNAHFYALSKGIPTKLPVYTFSLADMHARHMAAHEARLEKQRQ